jgi:hypothetical protein
MRLLFVELLKLRPGTKFLRSKHHATLAGLKLQPELVESLLDWCEAPSTEISSSCALSSR